VDRVEGKRQDFLELILRITKGYLPGVYPSRRSQISFILMAALCSGPAWSLGLGNLEVNSNLDEPLEIRIELLSGTADEIETAEAALASREEFELVNLDRLKYLEDLKFTIVQANGVDSVGASSGSYILLTSDQQMKEPFLHFLVRLNWSGGRLLREYTALIDPPIYAAEAPVQISSPRLVDDPAADAVPPIDTAIVVSTDIPDQPATSEDQGEATNEIIGEVPGENSTVIEATEESADESIVYVDNGGTSGESGDGEFAAYGPIEEGDTLSDIASQFSAQFPDIDMYQVMYVLVQENPAAFIDGNMNLMMKGEILRLSDISVVREVSDVEARDNFREHLYQW
jgi:pilus assembly protein FimV